MDAEQALEHSTCVGQPGELALVDLDPHLNDKHCRSPGEIDRDSVAEQSDRGASGTIHWRSSQSGRSIGLDDTSHSFQNSMRLQYNGDRDAQRDRGKRKRERERETHILSGGAQTNSETQRRQYTRTHAHIRTEEGFQEGYTDTRVCRVLVNDTSPGPQGSSAQPQTPERPFTAVSYPQGGCRG